MPLADGAAVDHEEGPVVARGGHDDARHVLVAAGDADVGVVVLGAGDGFDAVGDDLAGLEGETHAWGVSYALKREDGGILPSPPMVIASDTPMVLYCHASMLSFSTACLTVLPSSYTVTPGSGQMAGTQKERGSPVRWVLHGFPSHQTDAMPTWGAFFIMSSFGTPAAYSMAYMVRLAELFGAMVARPSRDPELLRGTKRMDRLASGLGGRLRPGASADKRRRGTNLGTRKVMFACHGVRPAVEGTAGGQGLELDVVVVLGLVAVLGRGVGASAGLIHVGFHFGGGVWMAALVRWCKKNDDAKEFKSWMAKGVKIEDGEEADRKEGRGSSRQDDHRGYIFPDPDLESESSAFPSFRERKALAIPHDDPWRGGVSPVGLGGLPGSW